ncbi:MAG: porin [Gallionella sp.]|nr:porin [Gallionella sp.]
MQKKLIVVALAAAFTLPVAAHAENGNFNFYGVADLSYDMVNTGDGTTKANGTTATSGTSKGVVSSNVSKFGFKGTEDLGDGLSANWQVEQQINIDDAAKNTFASRNTFVNLKSEKLGTVLFGTNDTPYKFASRKLDPFGDNIGDNRALLGNNINELVPATKATVTVPSTPGTYTITDAKAAVKNLGFELRPNNIFMYTTPTFSGFNAAVAMVNLKEANTLSSDKKDDLTSFAVMYDVAPFYGSVAHEVHKLESVAAGDEESASRAGFGYKPEDQPFELGAIYEKTNDNFGSAQANAFGHKTAYVSGKYLMGNNAIKLGYTKTGNFAGLAGTTTDSGATQVSVGYDHGLSKRTKLYALYTKITNGKGANYGFSQSSGAASTTSGFGTSPSVVSLGVKHTF